MCMGDIFLGLIAILFPPLPVWVKTGLCSADSLINILLCILGYFPGLLHSWYIIAKFPDPFAEPTYRPINQNRPGDLESGRVTYVYVQGGSAPSQTPRKPNNVGYGTTAPMAPAAPKVNQAGDGTWVNTEASAAGAGEGSSSADGAPAPPSYAQAVKGDHKIQTNE